MDAYRQIISYDAAPQSVTGVTPVVNKSGNITQMVWQNRGQTNTQGYNFEYDYLNRVVKSNYFDVTGGTGTMNNNYREYVTYDVRGNILTMGRHGLISPSWTRAKIDSLTYTYTSGTNKLSKINDLAANAYGFNMNGASTSATYSYDDNGSIKIDPYKKISNTTFNHLNLPDIISVTGSPNKEIRFTYDATGVKLRKQITLVGGTPSGLKQDYVEDIEYANDVIESISFLDGRAVWVSATSTWRYEFNVSDQLGNIRTVVSDMDNDGSLYNDFSTEIIQITSYYPFGLKMEGPYQNNGSAIDTRYLFNNKEFNDHLGLNLYDYGARWYDPANGRWIQIDPLSNFKPGWSPYRYSFNNPLSFFDPNGLFETRIEAKEYKRENNQKGNIKKQEDGSYAIINNKNHTSTSRDKEFGVLTSVVVKPKNTDPQISSKIISATLTIAAVTSQLDSPIPGPADIAAIGELIIGGLAAAAVFITFDKMKGGKQKQRDKDYGIDDEDFWNWWHREGKPDSGGKDIKSKNEADKIYGEWAQEGKPKVK